MPCLVAHTGPLAGQRVDVESELIVGRVDGDLVIEDAKLSRRHAVFRAVDGGLEVEDLGSTNGTFVAERRIQGPTRVGDGDEVRLGGSRFAAEVLPSLEATDEATQIDVEPDDPHLTQVDPEGTIVRDRAEPDDVEALDLPDHSPTTASPGLVGGDPGAAGAAFAPPAVRRGSGLATRSWVPVALSYGTVIVVAVALVVYFATR